MRQSPASVATRPREWASEIIAEPDRVTRRVMLEAVPEAYRSWVRVLVVNYFALKKKTTG